MKRTLLFLHFFAFIALAGSVASCRAQDSDAAKSSLKTVSIDEADSLLAKKRDGANDDIDRSRRNAITTAVENAAPAVVGINVTEVREVRYRDPWASMFENDPFFQQFQDMMPRRNSRVYRQELHGLGSGFIISPDGYIVTNDHVAGGAVKVIVTTTDGKQHEARIIGSDPATDVALLKIDGANLPYLDIGNSDDVIVGEWAIALGNPFGLFDINAKPTVTVGVISNTGVTLRPQDQRAYIDMVQTDAAISSGNSGGPLVNAVGEVIAMNTIIYSTSQSNRGAGSIGIGFAVPINRVMAVVEELKEKGGIDRDFQTGMSIRPIDANIARYLGLPTTDGAVIVELAPRSAAQSAGLEVGDVIVELNGRPVRSDEDVVLVINDSRVGDELTMKIVRKGETLSKTMKLTKRN
jgi:serine protease Do